MIVEVIRYRLAPGQENDFEDAYRQAAGFLADSPHCLAYQLTHCLKDRGRYLLIIHWDSADGHMKGFRASPEFSRFYTLVAPFFKNIEEMEHYEETGIALTKTA